MGQALIARFAEAQAAQAVSTAASQANVPGNPDAAWWCKLLGRAVGVLGGLIAFVSGLATLVVSLISPLCIIAGLLLMLLAVIVLIFEAPVCCGFISFTKPIMAFAEKRTYLQKAIIYCISALVTFFMCFGLSMLFGCGLIFTSGVVYGLMGIGRKADRQQMMDAAATDTTQPVSRPDETRAGLIDNDDTFHTGPFVEPK